jgi:hypothetical protein
MWHRAERKNGRQRGLASYDATTDVAVLPGVLGCLSLRRTVQVRKPIPRYRGTVTRLHAHLCGPPKVLSDLKDEKLFHLQLQSAS